MLLGMLFFKLARKRPERTKERLLNMVRGHLGADYDVATHFTPRYNPWDQRLCLVPDADLFDAISRGDASVVTDTIDTFTERGIRLSSGTEIDADIVVTATGLEIALMGGATFSVDGKPVRLADSLQYKGMMFSDVPNLAFTFGYTNASWTLKADLVARYVCRLLNAMRRKGVQQATPRIGGEAIVRQPFADFSSGYIQRALDHLPQQGDRKPWRLNQNYALDVMALRFGSVTEAMEFGPASRDAGGKAA